ncbi:hypothetical protein HMPREF3293_03082 [Christensenella minuta]|uniref:Uncharacterized protein n=1 Tax=Christensenella minuta TaxID=626937 RepID=A0A136Q0E5_9FIRM|nr:hypothetical protein HMPREF3293_03082 [Christensenella minuta]
MYRNEAGWRTKCTAPEGYDAHRRFICQSMVEVNKINVYMCNRKNRYAGM